MGLEIPGVHTALNLERGLELLQDIHEEEKDSSRGPWSEHA
jgi:hypothetical protein